MSGLDSWEDDQDAQQDDLARQTQQNLNLNKQPQRGNFQPGAGSFQPGATSFQPGASSFQPGGQQYTGYNAQALPQQGYGGYPQYAQQGYGQGYGYEQQNYGQNYGAQNGFGGYDQQRQQSSQNQSQAYRPPQQQSQPRKPPVIAKRPSATDGPQTGARTSQPASNGNAASPATSTMPKTLSIGGDGAAKVETSGATKVLNISAPRAPAAASAPPTAFKPAQQSSASKANPDSAAPAAGAKAVASKAIAKTGEPGPANAGDNTPTSSGRNSPTSQEKQTAARHADAVEKEQAADVDNETLREMYGKEHVNVIFLGHVDAGKSTLGGSILYATGMVDERTMDKYKKEAKEAGQPSWYLSWALDLTKEERSKGKTVEVGRGFFETEKRRYSILDAPGHKTFVPNMIVGAVQADVGCLVISARKGEYETGFEKGGQTREHGLLAKTQGVNKLVIVVNKMDDPTVEWSKDRYEECIKKLTVFLKQVGFNPKTDLEFMPVSAQTSVGIRDRVPKSLAPWHDGPSLLEYLDSMQTLERKVNAPFMMPVSAKYRDMGTVIEGKIESGVVRKGQTYKMMPSGAETAISTMYGETEDEIDAAACGEQVRLKLRSIEEEDIMPGFVLCSPQRPVHCVSAFEAQIQLLELKSILSAGFNCVIHVHSATEEVTFGDLLHKLERGTNRKSKKKPGFAVKGMAIIARLEVTSSAGSICVERFEDYPQLGRFTLRDQGQTIAIGKITKLLTDGPGT